MLTYHLRYVSYLGILIVQGNKEERQPLIVQNMTKKKNIKLRETEDYTAINILSKAVR